MEFYSGLVLKSDEEWKKKSFSFDHGRPILPFLCDLEVVAMVKIPSKIYTWSPKGTVRFVFDDLNENDYHQRVAVLNVYWSYNAYSSIDTKSMMIIHFKFYLF